MKSFLKKIVVRVLASQVRRLRRGNNFKIIGVVGSIGKTSTKLAIAKVLESDKRVRYQEGNYNDIVSVPLVFFSRTMPQLWNIFTWLQIFIKNEIQILSRYPFDFVVLELGTDKSRDIGQFRSYLDLDIAVVTAVTLEHMQFFGSLREVAEEEFSVSYFSDLVFANKDLCHLMPENIDHKKVIFYGKEFGSVYKVDNIRKSKEGFDFEIYHEGKKLIEISYPAVSEVQLYSITVSVAIAQIFQISREKVKNSLAKIESFPGRMQKLAGIKNSIIIDDTYNASPESMKIALDTLYDSSTSHRIAILGQMNELGKFSEEEHKKIGKYCSPKLLDLVVTIGRDANKFIAEEAEKNGCPVYRAKNSVDAGKYVKSKIKDQAVVLAKGSQNGVFAEEALKPLLLKQSDSSFLVRQDSSWMKKKI